MESGLVGFLENRPKSEIKPRLVDTQGKEYPLEGSSSFVLGKGPACHVRVDDVGVSRYHAIIHLEEGNGSSYLSVIDSRSENGTYFNGELLPKKEPAILTKGSRIRLGSDGPEFVFIE